MSYAVNSLTSFLYTAVASDATLVSSGTKVFYEQFITEDINQTPAVYINWAGENTNQDDSFIGSPVVSRPFNLSIDYTFYLQCGNYDQDPTQTVDSLQRLWTSVYQAVVTAVVNSSGTLGCQVNFQGWNRQPDSRSTTDLKLNRQTIYSDLAVMTFEVFG